MEDIPVLTISDGKISKFQGTEMQLKVVPYNTCISSAGGYLFTKSKQHDHAGRLYHRETSFDKAVCFGVVQAVDEIP